MCWYKYWDVTSIKKDTSEVTNITVHLHHITSGVTNVTVHLNHITSGVTNVTVHLNHITSEMTNVTVHLNHITSGVTNVTVHMKVRFDCWSSRFDIRIRATFTGVSNTYFCLNGQSCVFENQYNFVIVGRNAHST